MLKEPPDAVGNFIHLRYLNLVKYSKDRLHETICYLCNLQSLKITINSDRFKELPEGMGKLIKLRHFILDSKFGLNVKFPKGFGRLISLRTISHFNISGGCKLEELKNFNHLQWTLQINGLGGTENAYEAENAQLKKKIGLLTLVSRFNKWNDEDRGRRNDALILNALEPPLDLEYLHIDDYLAITMFPN